jgi:hypothetical protein
MTSLSCDFAVVLKVLDVRKVPACWWIASLSC